MKKITLVLLNALILSTLSGCSAIVEKQTKSFTDALSEAIVNFEDLETVKTATPTFLILVETFARGEDASAQTQLTAAQMYSSFAGAFVEDPKRQKALNEKAFSYALKGSCNDHKKWCGIDKQNKTDFQTTIESITAKDLNTAYALAVTWLSYIQVNSGDWNAIADLAKAKAILEKVLIIDESHDNAGPHLYLGAIATIIPPALGGKPELAKMHFEKAIDLTEGQHFVVKVEYARRYARMMFDQELHHKLLTEVAQANPNIEGFTLMNQWAQEQAALLLADEAEYFE